MRKKKEEKIEITKAMQEALANAPKMPRLSRSVSVRDGKASLWVSGPAHSFGALTSNSSQQFSGNLDDARDFIEVLAKCVEEGARLEGAVASIYQK